MSKTNPGNFFEDFAVGREIVHATPRTVTSGDVALYVGLTGSRFVVPCSDEFARQIGFDRAPVDDLLTFHMVFGKTVPDISLNAVANLGYAGGVFGHPVFPGDTLSAHSTVIGLRELSNRQNGVVWVRTRGANQNGVPVLDYVRWVMVRKRDPATPAPDPVIPDLPDAVPVADLHLPAGLDARGYDFAAAGEPHCWDDYTVGERIDHVDGMTLEEAEHAIATRLYQNTAKVHFNQFTERDGRFGRRLVYGGHVVSLARTLSFNGLANGFRIAAINGGRHVAPVFAGDTIHAWSEILDVQEVPGRADIGALRLRLVATRDRPCADFPLKAEDGGDKDHSAVVLDFDYTVFVPRR